MGRPAHPSGRQAEAIDGVTLGGGDYIVADDQRLAVHGTVQPPRPADGEPAGGWQPGDGP